MKALHAAQIRNVAVVGHNTVGKTTLVSAMLHAAGATTRPGASRKAPAPTDFDAEEIDRKISINLAAAFADAPRRRINLHRRPRLRHLRLPRRASGLRGGRGAPRRRRRLGRRGPDREGVEVRRGVRAPGALRRQPDGPRARLASTACIDDLQKKFGRGRHRAPDSRRRGEGVSRHDRPRPDGERTSYEDGKRVDGPDPGRARRARRRPSTRRSSRWSPREKTT